MQAQQLNLVFILCLPSWFSNFGLKWKAEQQLSPIILPFMLIGIKEMTMC